MLKRADGFNNRWLLEPLGNIPPAKAGMRCCAMLDEAEIAAELKQNVLRKTRCGSASIRF